MLGWRRCDAAVGRCRALVGAGLTRLHEFLVQSIVLPAEVGLSLWARDTCRGRYIRERNCHRLGSVAGVGDMVDSETALRQWVVANS